MRLEFVVSRWDGGWRVKRGHTRAIVYRSYEAALRAATALAKVAVANGDHATVKVLHGGGFFETLTVDPATLEEV